MMEMRADHNDPRAVPVRSFPHKPLADLNCDRLTCNTAYVVQKAGYAYGTRDVTYPMEGWFELERHPHARQWMHVHMGDAANEAILFSRASPVSVTSSALPNCGPSVMIRTFNNGMDWNVTTMKGMANMGDDYVVDIITTATSKGNSNLIALSVIDGFPKSSYNNTTTADHHIPDQKPHLFLSMNYGNSWKAIPSPFAWETLAIQSSIEFQNATMIASHPSSGVHYSHDEGRHWSLALIKTIDFTGEEKTITNDSNAFQVHAEKVFIDNSGKYATAIVFNGSIYRSEDRGVSWQQIDYPRGAWVDIDGIDNGKVQYILSSGAFYNQEDSRYSLSISMAKRGIHRSLDFGRSWSFVSDPFEDFHHGTQNSEEYEWHSIAIDGHVGSHLIVGSTFSRVFVSNDYGRSWSESPRKRWSERMGLGGYIFYFVYAVGLLYIIRRWGKKREQMLAAAAVAPRGLTTHEDGMVHYSTVDIELPAFSLDETPAIAHATSIEGQIYTAVPCNDDDDDDNITGSDVQQIASDVL